MRKIYIYLIVIMSSYYSEAQNLVFTYDELTTNDNISTLTVSAFKSITGTENVMSYNYGFYFKSSETTISGITPGWTGILSWNQLTAAVDGSLDGWNWDGTGAILEVSYEDYDRIFIGGITDGNFAGSDISTTPVPLLTLEFDNTTGTSNYGDFVYMGGSDTNVAWAYSDINFNEFPVVAQESNRAQELIYITLPLKLLYFDVETYNENSSLLSWNTIDKMDIESYEIERSYSLKAWENIGDVSSLYESRNTKKEYQFIDDDIALKNGENIVYYRLKIIDKDGEYTYSDVKHVVFNLNNKDIISIYPNPTRQILNLDLSEIQFKNTELELLIFDQNGRKAMNSMKLDEKLQSIDLSELPAGTYNLVFKNGEEMITEKIVKIE